MAGWAPSFTVATSSDVLEADLVMYFRAANAARFLAMFRSNVSDARTLATRQPEYTGRA
jgi:hypothetical protein